MPFAIAAATAGEIMQNASDFKDFWQKAKPQQNQLMSALETSLLFGKCTSKKVQN